MKKLDYNLDDWGIMEIDFDILKNKKIISIDLDYTTRYKYDKQNHTDGIRFNLENGFVQYRAFGDCCSTSYIESLDNPSIFDNATFLSVEVIEGIQENIDYTDVHKWKFYKFKTSKGMCTLSFRNESNGYYNGELRISESTLK